MSCILSAAPHLHTSPSYLAVHLTHRPLITLVSGLSFTGLIIGFIVVFSRRAKVIDALVVAGTEDLIRSQKLLLAGQAGLRKVNSAIAELPGLVAIQDGEHGPALRSICEMTAMRFNLDRMSIWLFDAAKKDLRCENRGG
ncbi:MAG: hypothetical protein ACKVHO_23520 [Verrucomicrobiia bacterium]